MRTWSCTLEVTTPMALAGADLQRAELRPNTCKNMLRWWYRAGRGRLDRDEEARLFGDVGAKDAKGRASSFRLRLYPCNKEAEESLPFDQLLGEEQLLTRNGNLRLQGLSYLGHFLDPPSNPARGVLRAGAQFRVDLQFPFWFEERDRRAVWASLWLLVWLGGLGSRNRRGFGGLKAVEAEPTDHLHLSFPGGSAEALRAFLEKNLYQARCWLNAPMQERPVPPEYTALVPGWTRIFVDDLLINSSADTAEYGHPEPPGWAKALDAAGEDLKNYRSKLPSAYEEVARFLEREGYAPDTVDRAAFGLPLTFWYPPIEQNEGSRERATAQVGQHQRRASPLFIRAHQTDKEFDLFALVFVLMKAQLLPEGDQIEMSCEARNRHERVDQPDFSRLDEFFEKDESTLGVFDEPGPKDYFLPVSLQPPFAE